MSEEIEARYYHIDEGVARRANILQLFEHKAGSATAEYRAFGGQGGGDCAVAEIHNRPY